MAKGIYKYSEFFGRMGSLEGVFVADSSEVAAAMGREVCFGEVLGKHSEVRSTMSADDIKLASDDPKFVALFEELDLASGTNPIATLHDYDLDNPPEADGEAPPL